MKLLEIFKTQITEQISRSFWLFYYVIGDNNYMTIEKMNVWKIGSLLETHTYDKKDQRHGIPVFRPKKVKINVPK